MAFFSFSLLKDPLSYLFNQIEPKLKYFSKDITLWKELNNRNKKKQICILNYEKRLKLNSLGKTILICLPPKFGLGDAVEYSISLKSIIDSNKFSKIGVAFCSNFTFIFKNLFSIDNIYPLLISEQEMQQYETIFHITIEIESLRFQKYKRSNIAEEICRYFNVPVINFKIDRQKISAKNIKEISIFPVSTSVIRSLPYEFIDKIIKKFQDKYYFKIFIDDSNFSRHLVEKNSNNNCSFISPRDTKSLITEIEKIEFGIFMDSGPLHIAKIFDKKGILIETSVSSNILLSNSKKVYSIDNQYKSNFCNGPCGLVDVFSLDKSVGCYESHKISYEDINSLQSFKILERWNKKDYNSDFILNPVGCVRNINIENIFNILENNLKEY